MDQTSKIKEIVISVLDEGVELYDVSWVNEGNNRILQIAIMHHDGTMDIDTCVAMSEKISEKLDEDDVIASEYFLEVCSPGAERVLSTPEQIKGALHEYVYVKLSNPKAGLSEVKGTLQSIDDTTIQLMYMDKAVKKKIEIDMDNIALIRLSVKI